MIRRRRCDCAESLHRSAIKLRLRNTTRHEDLGVHHQHHKDKERENDGTGSSLTDLKQPTARWNDGTTRTRQERDQAVSSLPRISMRCRTVGYGAINKANLWIASACGRRANSSAACQGSTSKRASAERTLTSIPFLSSPIGANRKLSNSDPRGTSEVQRVMT